MEFSVKTGALAKQRTPCLVLGIFERRQLSAAAESWRRSKIPRTRQGVRCLASAPVLTLNSIAAPL